MSEWRMTTVGELGEIFDGPHATPTRIDEGPYFLNITSLNQGRLNLTHSDHVSERDFSRWTKRVTPRANDLLFSYETRLGEAALMPSDVRACLGRRMALIRPRAEIVDAHFLLYLYLGPAFQKTIELNTIHGATVNRIPLNRMSQWELRMPPLPEQQAIAEVLGALDDKIAANTRLAATAEELLRAEIDDRWLKRPDRDSHLSDYVDLNPKTKLPLRDTDPAYVDMKKLPESGWSIDAADHRPAKGGARFLNGDTLLARITPCLENGKTGYVDTLDEGEVAIGSTEFIVLRPHNHLAAPLGFLLAKESRFREFAIQRMVGTSGRQRVAAGDLSEFEMPSPDASWLDSFSARAAAIFEAVRVGREENRTLAATRDALLPTLMSGALRVKEAAQIAEEAGM